MSGGWQRKPRISDEWDYVGPAANQDIHCQRAAIINAPLFPSDFIGRAALGFSLGAGFVSGGCTCLFVGTLIVRAGQAVFG